MPTRNNPMFSILVHYSEIGLKKNNRSFFEKKFINNLSKHISELPHSKINTRTKTTDGLNVIRRPGLDLTQDFRYRPLP